uniref:Uncharacterized protein n=1 Tax=Romanomermis culicivorax TaxID=13658 RepID=A0A915KMB0_ROMCU
MDIVCLSVSLYKAFIVNLLSKIAEHMILMFWNAGKMSLFNPYAYNKGVTFSVENRVFIVFQ